MASKAIPIRDPNSGERLPETRRKAISADAVPVHAFDVYARPFVPEALTAINTLHGYTDPTDFSKWDTPPKTKLVFGDYISKNFGSDYLSPIPLLLNLPQHPHPLAAANIVTQRFYELHFRYLLEAEMQSQTKENESYSLYGHNVTLEFSGTSDDQAICTIIVPGLRENSPYVEEDDIVQLRQLRYDHMGVLIGMEHWLEARRRYNTAYYALPGAPGWTGIVYNARVIALKRKEEQLIVKVCGTKAIEYDFQQPRLGTRHQLRFNIQFPTPLLRYLPMQQVLPKAQQALNRMEGDHWLRSMLFPIKADCDVQEKLHRGFFKTTFFDSQLNFEQKKAVENVCSQNYGTLPFLISGPPGTGKTKSLVEVALQLVNNVAQVFHILVCAPSDPAADTIVQRLANSLELGPADLLRLNRPERTFAEVPDRVLPFCYVEEDQFTLPPFANLMTYKIVVTTCRDASLLMYARMTNADLYAAEYGLRRSIHPQSNQASKVELHWNALLIDEAAQAIEPEALIPLCVVAPPLDLIELAFTPLFMMAGDEYQLGPRTSLSSSPLKRSLFARLFALPVYTDHPLARGKAGRAPRPLNSGMLPIIRPPFTDLIKNYRSHPAILAVPSALFYADTLEAEATDTERLDSWTGWRGTKWPVLFHNNASEDDLEADGGGWYNTGEARLACQYAEHLVNSGLVNQEEICIMSPFKSQVKCLRNSARARKLWKVDVGPTEAFQGLERGVVILCTTRSKQRFVERDKELGWGIIGMPNKINVAITRAKFGLIVIGKRDLLLRDPNWKAFLGFCDRNGLVTDEDHVDENDMEMDYTRLEKVLLAPETLEENRVLRGINHNDDSWTGDMNGYE